MIYLVTQGEMDIIELIQNDYKSYIEISKILKRKASGVVSSLKYLYKFGLIDKEKQKYKANNYQFEIASKSRVVNQRYKLTNEDKFLKEIDIYRPSEEQKEMVKKLVREKLSRSEIAKQLRMTKSMLLWTMHEITNKSAEENADSIIMCNKLQFAVYRLIQKSDYTMMQIARELKAEFGDIRDAILFLEQCEAIKIKKNHNIINYIPLNKIIKLKEKK